MLPGVQAGLNQKVQVLGSSCAKTIGTRVPEKQHPNLIRNLTTMSNFEGTPLPKCVRVWFAHFSTALHCTSLKRTVRRAPNAQRKPSQTLKRNTREILCSETQSGRRMNWLKRRLRVNGPLIWLTAPSKRATFFHPFFVRNLLRSRGVRVYRVYWYVWEAQLHSVYYIMNEYWRFCISFP